MKTPSASSIHFQTKISDYCNLRIAPLVSKRSLDNIKPYLASLIIYRKAPPMRSGRIDWASLGGACGLVDELSAKLKEQIRPALEAIERWVENERFSDDDRPRPDFEDTDEARLSSRARSNRKTPPNVPPEIRAKVRAKPGVAPKPIEEFPQPLFVAIEDPSDFAAALIYQMRRHGDFYWHLFRALENEHSKLESSTIVSWIKGLKVPRTLDSLAVLSSVEKRYRLPTGYFKAKLPHQSRSAYGHEVGSDISASERRRLAWHLPDDFNTLPFEKRQEILEWVRRVIISGSTDYRRFQATASKQRYAIRFPSISYGGALSPRMSGVALAFQEQSRASLW